MLGDDESDDDDVALSEAELCGRIDERKRNISALRQGIALDKAELREVEALVALMPTMLTLSPPDSPHQTPPLVSPTVWSIDTCACFDTIRSAYTTTKRLLSASVDGSGGEIAVYCTTSWKTELWATNARLKWRAQRLATTPMEGVTGMDASWTLLLTPEQSNRGVANAERAHASVLIKMTEDIVVVKRGAERLSVAFRFRDGDSHYVGIAPVSSSATSSPSQQRTSSARGDQDNSDTALAEVDCQCWIFTKTLSCSTAWSVQYVG